MYPIFWLLVPSVTEPAGQLPPPPPHEALSVQESVHADEVLAAAEQVVPEQALWVPAMTGLVQTADGVPGLRQTSLVQALASLHWASMLHATGGGPLQL